MSHQTHDTQDHIRYTNEEIVKNLALLEGHFKVYQCGECIEKHLLTIEGLAEEGMGMDGKEPYETVRRWAKKARRREDFDTLYSEARDMRLMVQPHSHVHDFSKEIVKHMREEHNVTVPRSEIVHAREG